jgi:hypothetical protein
LIDLTTEEAIIIAFLARPRIPFMYKSRVNQKIRRSHNEIAEQATMIRHNSNVPFEEQEKSGSSEEHLDSGADTLTSRITRKAVSIDADFKSNRGGRS